MVMAPLLPKPEEVPPELRSLRRWVCWREEWREGSKKPTKIPMAPWIGREGPVNALDSANWTDLETALEWAKKLGLGVGIVLGKVGPGRVLTGVDLDHVIDEGGIVKPGAVELIQKTRTYAELSPSLRGIHILGWVEGELPHPIVKEVDGIRIEAYTTGRWLTFTGRAWKESPAKLGDLTPPLAELWEEEEPPEGKIEGLDIVEVFKALGGDLAKLRKVGKQLQGPHPIHGSGTGMNFSLNPEKNVWFCYRDWCGGGPVKLAALLLGVVSCEELRKRGRMGLTDKELEATLLELRKRGLLKSTPEMKREEMEKEKRAILSLTPEELEEITREMGEEELLEILSTTIKRDDVNKLIHFLAGLLTYTSDSQLTISNRGPSASGKSYFPLEITSLFFPSSDVMKFAYASPTSFFHDSGVWDSEKNAIRIDLERKILVFLDQPHDELLQRLRPLLSHDDRELVLKITDRREKKGLRTKTVIIRGFPTVFFCTGGLRMDEQESTRHIVLSPETSEEKLQEAVLLAAIRKGDPDAFKQMIESNPQIKRLHLRVLLIKHSGIQKVVVPKPEKVAQRFIETHPRLKPRHTRDIGKVLSLAQAWALLNLWHRKREGEILYANEEDVERAFKLYSRIAEPQELGVAPYIYQVWKEVFVPLSEQYPQGFTKREVQREYLKVYGRSLPDWLLRQEFLPAMEAGGLTSQEPDPTDRRRKVIIVHFVPMEGRGGSGKEGTPPHSHSLYFSEKGDTPHSHSLYFSEKGEKPGEGIGGEGDVCAPSPAPAQPQGGGEGAFAGSPPSLPPAPPETPAPQPQEEGSLWLVRFTEDYPGGLVGSLPGEIPGGACRVLTGWEVGELGRKFGFVEARKLEKGEVLVVRTLRPVPPGTFPWLSAELPPGKELVFLPDQAAELVSGGYAEILSTFEEWKTRQEGPNEGKAEEEPPHGTVQLILEFIRKKAPRPGMLVEKKDIYAWAGSLGISRERVDQVLRYLASRGVILDRGSVIERVR